MFENILWAVTFTSSIGGAGSGVITFRENKVFGGDSGYYYHGTYETDAAGRMNAKVHVKRYNAGWTSIFGPVAEFTLTLSGQAQGNDVQITGAIVGQPAAKIQITMQKLMDL